MNDKPLFNVFGARLSQDKKRIVLVLVTDKKNDRKFYNACISMDEAKKTYGCIDNKRNEAVIHVNLLNKPNDKTPF